MGRQSVQVDLAATPRAARELASGRVFVRDVDLAINDPCELVVRGGDRELHFDARVIHIDGYGGASIEILQFGPPMTEQIAELVIAVGDLKPPPASPRTPTPIPSRTTTPFPRRTTSVLPDGATPRTTTLPATARTITPVPSRTATPLPRTATLESPATERSPAPRPSADVSPSRTATPVPRASADVSPSRTTTPAPTPSRTPTPASSRPPQNVSPSRSVAPPRTTTPRGTAPPSSRTTTPSSPAPPRTRTPTPPAHASALLPPRTATLAPRIANPPTRPPAFSPLAADDFHIEVGSEAQTSILAGRANTDDFEIDVATSEATAKRPVEPDAWPRNARDAERPQKLERAFQDAPRKQGTPFQRIDIGGSGSDGEPPMRRSEPRIVSPGAVARAEPDLHLAGPARGLDVDLAHAERQAAPTPKPPRPTASSLADLDLSGLEDMELARPEPARLPEPARRSKPDPIAPRRAPEPPRAEPPPPEPTDGVRFKPAPVSDSLELDFDAMGWSNDSVELGIARDSEVVRADAVSVAVPPAAVNRNAFEIDVGDAAAELDLDLGPAAGSPPIARSAPAGFETTVDELGGFEIDDAPVVATAAPAPAIGLPLEIGDAEFSLDARPADTHTNYELEDRAADDDLPTVALSSAAAVVDALAESRAPSQDHVFPFGARGTSPPLPRGTFNHVALGRSPGPDSRARALGIVPDGGSEIRAPGPVHVADAPADELGETDEERRIARNIHERLRGLTLAEQIKKATSGDPTERMVLERMYHKNVWEALLRNPRLTAPEVMRIARMGALPRPLLEVIVGNGAWLQVPEVRRALLTNPRLQPDQIARVLKLLPKHELKLASTQTVYPHAVRDTAKRMLRD